MCNKVFLYLDAFHLSGQKKKKKHKAYIFIGSQLAKMKKYIPYMSLP